MSTTIHATNIGAQATDAEIEDFFKFCGKVASIKVTTEGSTKSATVTFEMPSAASTALLLNHTNLGGNEITITGENVAPPAQEPSTQEGGNNTGELRQEEKPYSRIVAEVLAHGYVVADQSLQKAIALDEQHGISTRFMNKLKALDENWHATERARAADQSYGITQRANSLLTGLGSYFYQKKDTPTGKRLVEFYTTSSKQVQDIHNEAKRLADLKKEQEGGGSLYKGLGLHKVLGTTEKQGSSADQQQQSGSGGEKTQGPVPGAAPANAPATESATKPTAESGTGNPSIIH
ncbi:uncharacterized protein B0T15DRAFT_513425 [Chaetomium strumarium]|uniref:RRM domain-containing protein n=1 Tax=Chaetomium strumarium TaxID=1170767 RepID=A0AAJ0GNI1_9PEZI|nr:hypothetical protein B0T15DRAFT_513425 [Chaetomium strumarium]